MPIPPKPFGIDELRARVEFAHLGVPRVDVAWRHHKAVYSLRRQEADAILAFLTDDGIGGPGRIMAGGWKTHFHLEGFFKDHTPFMISLNNDARYWRGSGTLGDQIVRPGLLDHLRPFTDPTPL